MGLFSHRTQANEQRQREAFESEAVPHAPSLFRIALYLTRDRSDAEDLVQETMIQALSSFHRFTPGTNCHAWLVTILYRTQSKKRRALGRFEIVGDGDEFIAETIPFDPPTPQELTDEEVLSGLAQLPRTYLEVIILSDVEELTYKEIAAALSLPLGTVMSRLSRGRKLLRAALAEYAQRHGFGRSEHRKHAAAPGEQ